MAIARAGARAIVVIVRRVVVYRPRGLGRGRVRVVVTVVAGAVVMVAAVVMGQNVRAMDEIVLGTALQGHLVQVMGADMQGQRVPSPEEEERGKKSDTGQPTDPDRTSHGTSLSSPSASLKEMLCGAGAAPLDRAAIHAVLTLNVILALHPVIASHAPHTPDPA